MTTPDDTRDRVIKLESEFEHLGDKVERLTKAVDKLTTLLEQIKGARALAVFLFGGAMFLVGKFSGYFTFSK